MVTNSKRARKARRLLRTNAYCGQKNSIAIEFGARIELLLEDGERFTLIYENRGELIVRRVGDDMAVEPNFSNQVTVKAATQ